MQTNQTSITATAPTTAEEIKTHDGHSASDYVSDCHLRPEAVRVRLHRDRRGIYVVEISILDRGFTFEDDVANAVALAIGGRVLTSGCGNAITVTARAGFRAKPGFVTAETI